MLILTRCPGQGSKSTICIGKDIEVTLLGIEGDVIRVAVAAPAAIPIGYENSRPASLPSGRVDKPAKRSGILPPL